MKPHNLNLKSLQIFQALVEQESMTHVAHHLKMTQPAVSYALQKLEQQLEIPLFDRQMRPMRPTAAGALLYQHAEKLIRDIEHVKFLVQSLDSPTVPQLRIGLIDSYSIAIGPKLMSALKKQVTQLSLWSGISPGLEADLFHRDLDFIVCPNPLNDSPALESTVLYREPYVFVTERKQTTKDPAALFQELIQKHPLIRYSLRSRIGSQIDTHLRWLRLNVHKGMEFDGSEAVMSMVAEGLGWAITTPLCLLHARSFQDELLSYPLPEPGLRRSLYLINHRDAFPSFRRSFIEQSAKIIRQQFNQHLALQNKWMIGLTEVF